MDLNKLSDKDYNEYVKKKAAPSPLGKNLAWAFTVGGGICVAGQALLDFYRSRGLDEAMAGTAVSVTLIALTALLWADELAKHAFLLCLGEEDVKKKFPAMYNAFCYGAPPHAGIAPGVDRMVMLLAGEDSIREVIPFPMNKNAQDVLMGAPSEVTQKQLDELHIAVVGDVEE